MAAAPDQLLWQLVKRNNAFLRKNLNNQYFSAEPGNLYNRHSYKYSGLANSKTVDLAPADSAVVLTKSKPTKGKGKPAKSAYSNTMKRDVRRMMKTVGREVEGFRPDLKKASIAKLSAIHKSLRVIKAGPKKAKK
mmetsp:Transcript_43078/g.102283  ORF Transcript_43078/g.102283 Transcript_43078/m.102283 type:complete len:135 (-) Transcript_43078:58-462(-)